MTLRRTISSLSAAIVGLGLLAGAASADGELKSYTTKAKYDDVRFELTTAIEGKGLNVDFNGQLSKMLDRTGADIGATKPVYKTAEYFTFCSAKLSREMMEADPANVGFCPYVVFLYETAARPGEVVVGYRRPPSGGSAASKTAFAAIDTLLDGIVKAAAK